MTTRWASSLKPYLERAPLAALFLGISSGFAFAMIGATLTFARDQSADEPRRPTDLTSLLQSVVDDMRDAGFAVRMQAVEAIVCECRPAAASATHLEAAPNFRRHRRPPL